jgi:hypothetical protein
MSGRPVDQGTYEQFRAVALQAMAQGRTLVEALDLHRLLLTPAREKDIRLDELRSLWRALDGTPAATLMRHGYGRDHGTPQDMYRAVMIWLEETIDMREKGPRA